MVLTTAEDVSPDVLGRLELSGVRFGDVSLKDGLAGHLLDA
jgi:hypothetical protein